jgi:hypothetical protein
MIKYPTQQIRFIKFVFILNMCLAGLLTASGCKTTKLYYIRNANMIPFSDAHTLTATNNRPVFVNYLLNGHYITKGDSIVLIVRRFDTGNFFAIDDEHYEKLTFEIRKYSIGVPMRINSPNIKIYYSSGTSGFISKGHGVFSSYGSGTITIKKAEKHKLVVGVDLFITAKPAGPFPFSDRNIHFQETLSFQEKLLNELTPWLGIPDTKYGHEVYP